MKIGILTYHRSHNYGALLQSIAIRLVLEKMGHEVYYVDYWPGYHRRMYAIFNIRYVIRKNFIASFLYLYRFLITYRNKKLRIMKMMQFISAYIDPYCKPMTDKFDILIYGSDQIWRKQPERVGYNPIYFGDHHIRTSRHVSYAASMGILPTDDKDKNEIRKLVAHLDYISVREAELAAMLRTLGINNVSVCLDPVLLLKQEQWNAFFKNINNNRGKYIVFYDLLPNSFSLQEIKKFAEINRLSLKIIRGEAMNKDTAAVISTATPDKFVDLIRNADFVFTSSFHGLVFAILFNRPFYASFALNSDRASSLLSVLNLENYLLDPLSPIPQVYKSIDYSAVNKRLSELRQKSLNYLYDSCK